MRLIFNKKTLLLLGAFMLVNIVLFVTEQYDENKGSLSGIRSYNETVDSLSVYDNDELMNAFSEKYPVIDENYKSKLMVKIVYITGYYDEISGIITNAQKMKSLVLFNRDNKYTSSNINKTMLDFERIKGLEVGLTHDRAVGAFSEYGSLMYIIMIPAVYAVYAMFGNENRRVNTLLYSMKRGRWQLMLRNVRDVLLFVVLESFIFTGILYMLSVIIYGSDDMGAYIQGISAFSRFPYPMTIMEYLIMHSIVTALSAAVLTSIVILIFTMFQNRKLALPVLALIVAVQAFIRNTVGVSSNLKLLRYLNIMSLIKSHELKKEYMNLNFFGTSVSSKMAVAVFAAVVLVISLALSLLIFNFRYPKENDVRIICIENYLMGAYDRLLSSCGRCTFEVFKLLSHKGGLLIAAVLCLNVYVVIKSDTSFTELKISMDEVYDKYGGDNDWEGFSEYIDGLYAQIDQYGEAQAEIVQRMGSGELDASGFFEYTKLESQKDAIKVMLEEFSAKLDIHNILKKSDIDTAVISDRGYTELLGKGSIFRESIIWGTLMLALMLMAASTSMYERSDGMIQILGVSARELKGIWCDKLRALMLMGTVAVAFAYGFDIWHIISEYGLKDFNAPVQSLLFLKQCSFHVSIGQYAVSVYLFKIVLLFAGMAFVLCLSAHKSIHNRVYIPLCFAGFCALYAAGIRQGIKVMLIMTVSGIIIGVASLILSLRLWCSYEA